MVTLLTPTFTNLDVGLPGGNLNPNNARSTVAVEWGQSRTRFAQFGFVGFTGEFRHTLSDSPVQVVWRLMIRAVSLSVLRQIDLNITAARGGGEGVFTDKDNTAFARTTLDTHQRGTRDIIQSPGETFGWVMRSDVLTFTVLAPF